MRIGVISEGHADRAVVTNIIVGLTGIDRSEIIALRPTYLKDETDKAADDPNTKSSYSIIKKECEERELIDGFLAIEGQEFVVIHIDTAEADRYGVKRPDKKDQDFCKLLRNAVIDEINKWLNADLSKELLYAVAIEEIDAWVLTLYEKNSDSTRFIDAKKRLQRTMSRLNVEFIHDPYDYYLKITKDFSKKKIVTSNQILSSNCSLLLFCEEVINKVIPKIKSE